MRADSQYSIKHDAPQAEIREGKSLFYFSNWRTLDQALGGKLRQRTAVQVSRVVSVIALSLAGRFPLCVISLDRWGECLSKTTVWWYLLWVNTWIFCRISNEVAGALKIVAAASPVVSAWVASEVALWKGVWFGNEAVQFRHRRSV